MLNIKNAFNVELASDTNIGFKASLDPKWLNSMFMSLNQSNHKESVCLEMLREINQSL